MRVYATASSASAEARLSPRGPSEDDRLQAQYDGIPVPCYTWRAAGAEFVLERANRAADERTGGRIHGLLGRTARDLFPGSPIQDDLARCLREQRTVRHEHDHRLASTGEVRRMDTTYVFVPPDTVMAHAEDVTERRAQEERLKAGEARLRAVLGALDAGVLTLDASGRVMDVNPAVCRILGLDRERLLNDPDWWLRLSPRLEDGTPVNPVDGDSPGARAVRTGEPERDVTMLLTRPDGDEGAVSLSYMPLMRDGGLEGLVVSVSDLTERRRLRERLVHQALHDPLTALPNRLLFQERLEQALARTQRGRIAVLLLGLDDFKAINDAAGHAAGDALLEQVARRLARDLGPAETLARFGGDEFALLCELEDELDAGPRGERLLKALEPPFDAGRPVVLTATVGIAVEQDGRRRSADLVQGADAAMHRAKARGGAGYEVFDRAMGGRLRDRLRIQDGLRQALARDELRLHYQPIVELQPRAVIAVEALVRWQHPEEGLLGPGRFLPVAERHGRLISAIGDWVLRRACAEAGRWPPSVRVSVNVSARELGEPGFAERVAGTIAAAGVDPHRVALEITETALMEGGEASIQGLERLAGLGLRLYLDDFGTGYSSLTRLARLPLAGIKLDRSFVARATGERDRRIVEAALSIGRAAELTVIAEGVETEEQLALLRSCGCHRVQGYLLGRPAPPEQVTLT
jgi:diguanylate cyclase (GGDEF)-like protein/PAS domain S-box-containing protein